MNDYPYIRRYYHETGSLPYYIDRMVELARARKAPQTTYRIDEVKAAWGAASTDEVMWWTVDDITDDDRRLRWDLPPYPYPEHVKLKRIKDKSQMVKDFLTWCWDNKGAQLCHNDLRDYPTTILETDVDKMIAGFFEIDLDKLELEKRAMLEEQRKLNEKK